MPPGVGYGGGLLFGSDPKYGLLSQAMPQPQVPPQQATAPSASPIPNRGPLPTAPGVQQGGGANGGFMNQLLEVITGLGSDMPDARKAALLQAGLAGLQASTQPGAKLNNVLPAIMQQGRAAGTQFGREAQYEQLGQGERSLDQLYQQFSAAIQSGDPESARSIASVINALEAAERPRNLATRITTIENDEGEERRVVIDNQGNILRDLGKAPGSSRVNTSLSPDVIVDPETGERQLAVYNRETGRYQPVEGALPPQDPGSVDERQAAAYLQMVPDAKDYLDSVTQAPGRVQQALQDRGIREFTTPEQQQLNIYGNLLADAWLRMTTGARYGPEELANSALFFTPQPGDRKEALEAKRRNRDNLMQMLRFRAGRVADRAVDPIRDPETGEPAEPPEPRGGAEDFDPDSPFETDLFRDLVPEN